VLDANLFPGLRLWLHPGLYAAAHIRGLRKEKNFMITIDDSFVSGEIEELYDHD
jgi:hypothetical protein